MPEKVEGLTIEDAKNHLGEEVIPIDSQPSSGKKAPKRVITGTLETSKGNCVINLETIGGPNDGKWTELSPDKWSGYKLRRR